MPFLDLLEESPHPESNSLYFPIHAAMLYPRDEEKRRHWFAAAMAAHYADFQAAGAPEFILSDFHGLVGTLWELKLAPQRVFKDGIARFSRACLSGHTLLYLLRLHEHHPNHCHLERAKALVIEFAPQEGMTLSDSQMDKVWAEFRSVSHLWAASVLMVHENRYPEPQNRGWLELLSLGEALRMRAETARLLKSRETWKAPRNRGVPDLETGPEIAPLSQGVLQFLKDQFPG